jgi:hypothetical protein
MEQSLTIDPVITADDVVRAGACSDGVAKVVKRLANRLAAAMPASQVAKLVGADNHRYVTAAAKLDGYGYGDGSGYGYGDGSGYGYGYGSGYGSWLWLWRWLWLWLWRWLCYGYGYGYGSGYG